MRIVFRVDSSVRIGSGHLMRCLTLAGGFRDRGAEILFVCRKLNGDLSQLVRDRGFDLRRLRAPTSDRRILDWNDHATWLEVSWEKDADECVEVLRNFGVADWLVVDHYALDNKWEKCLRPYAEKIMVIDDLADRYHDCDLLLDQNFYAELETRYDGLVPASCEKLLGPHYALLRPEFHQFRECQSVSDGKVRRVLVFYGGSDRTNETGKALQAIANLKFENVNFDIVVGQSNSNKITIENICRTLPNVDVHCQVENMAEMMAAADLYLGAGGTTTWERSCLGLPSVVTTVASNQEELTKYCAKKGLLLWLGRCQDVTALHIESVLRLLLHSPVNFECISETSMRIVDGNGVHRVVTEIFSPEIIIRKAVHEDCKKIYGWRNAEETRKFFFDPQEVRYDVHEDWLNNVLNNPERVLLLGEINDTPIGVLRYDLSDKSAFISIYLVPGLHQRGLGSKLLVRGSAWVAENLPEIENIVAEIKTENIASIKAFKSAGYSESNLVLEKKIN